MKSSLLVDARWLVETMQKFEFCTIFFVIQGNRVQMNPAPRVIENHRVAKKGSSGRTVPDDYALKSEVIELLSAIPGRRDGTKVEVTVRYGLPVEFNIEEPAV